MSSSLIASNRSLDNNNNHSNNSNTHTSRNAISPDQKDPSRETLRAHSVANDKMPGGNSSSYPSLAVRLNRVNHLEKKLLIDQLRLFEGVNDQQRITLLKLLDKNAMLRQKGHLEPGIGEKISDPLYVEDEKATSRSSTGSGKRKSDIVPSTSVALATGDDNTESKRVSSVSAASGAAKIKISSISTNATTNSASRSNTTGTSSQSEPREVEFEEEDQEKKGGGGTSWLTGGGETGIGGFGKMMESIQDLNEVSKEEGGNLEEGEAKECTIDLFLLEYPLEEYVLIGGVPEDFEETAAATSALEKTNSVWNKPASPGTKNLKQMYGKFVNNAIIQNSSNNVRNDLEQEAITAMRMVSADLQSWVLNVLDHSINLDPQILAQVAEMDERALQDKKEGGGTTTTNPPPTSTQTGKQPHYLDVDVSGFNVLLNACKPAMLEARPPMKLNVVTEVTRGLDGIQKTHGTKEKKDEKSKPRRVLYGAWYVPPKHWKVQRSHGPDSDLNHADPARGGGGGEGVPHVFGGIVQQKLDDIAKKRAADMEAYFAVGGGGGVTTGSSPAPSERAESAQPNRGKGKKAGK